MIDSRRLRIGLLGVLAASSVGAWVAFRKPSASVSGIGSTDPTAVVEWCAEGLEAIPGGGCWSAPRGARDAPVIVYLHGRYEATSVEGELDRQKRVAKKANERGFAVLALRGEVGACQRAELASWVCWPSNERTAGNAPAFIARWSTALAEVSKRTTHPRRLVLGFSNGAYFAGLMALRGLFDASAFVVAAGGPTEPVEKRPRMPPILLLTGDEDPSIEDTMRFDRMLKGVGWPHDIYSRDGGHLLTDADITLALTFFERSVREPMPLTPPLSSRRPSPVRKDAGEEATPAARAPSSADSDAASSDGDRDAD